MRLRITVSARAISSSTASSSACPPNRASSRPTCSAALREVPSMVLKSPRRSRAMRMLSNSSVSQASFIRPRSQIRVGAMRSPSW